jgi:mxaA protein
MKPFFSMCLISLVWITPAKAEPPVAENVASPPAVSQTKTRTVQVLHIQNPPHYAGIQLGDVLQRRITLSAPATFTLDSSKLPLKGLQRNGVELRQVQVTQASQGGNTLYTLAFEYQVFASSGQPVQLQLSAEQLVFSGSEPVTIPAWRFWLMAQLPDRLQPAKPTLLGQRPPQFLETQTMRQGLVASLALTLLGGLLLLYRNASWSWLPMLNGPFAQAYRRLQRLPATHAGATQAALVMQQAFNQHFGQQMLASHVPAFLAQKPTFTDFATQIQQFYVQSNTLLYDGQMPALAEYLQQCKALTRQLRSCERGV